MVVSGDAWGKSEHIPQIVTSRLLPVTIYLRSASNGDEDSSRTDNKQNDRAPGEPHSLGTPTMSTPKTGRRIRSNPPWPKSERTQDMTVHAVLTSDRLEFRYDCSAVAVADTDGDGRSAPSHERNERWDLRLMNGFSGFGSDGWPGPPRNAHRNQAGPKEH